MAAIAASLSAALSQREPLRVRPERCLPAERSLPGHCPAQEAKCRALGNTVMSGPISAMITSALRRWTPGIVQSSSTACAKRGDALLDRLREPVDLLVQEVQVREDRADQQRVQVVKAALERLLELRQLLTQPALGQLGEDLGIGRPRDQCVEHRAPGHAEQV